MKKKISLVVPCYNEQGNVTLFYNEVNTKFSKKEFKTEIVFIDDGSKDNTLKELKTLLRKKDGIIVKVVEFSRNFGKESAIYAGLSNATGDYVVIIDADMQQPPALVLNMIKVLEEDENYDVVCYFQDKRIESKLVGKLKSCFYKAISKMSGIEFRDGASDFRLMRRYVVDAILSLTESGRFSKGIFSWVGFNTYYLPYTPNERANGKSSFNIKKLFKYAFSGIIAFSITPLKFATYSGITFSALSFIYLIIVLIKKIFFTIKVPGYATIVILILLLGGLILLSLGIIGEYIARIYLETKKRPIYVKKYILTNEEKN